MVKIHIIAMLIALFVAMTLMLWLTDLLVAKINHRKINKQEFRDDVIRTLVIVVIAVIFVAFM